MARNRQEPAAVARILIVGPAWVGDMIMAQCLFKVLRARHPDAAIDVLAPPATLPLLDFMPEVRRAIEMPFRHGELALAGRRALGRGLRREGYDIAIVVPRTLKAAAIAYWAGVPVRIGHPRGRAFGLLTARREIDPKRVYHQAARFAALAGPGPGDAPLPAPALRVSPARTEAALRDNALAAPARPLLVLAPGSGNTPSKRWPADRFAALARTRHGAGWDVWLMGAAGDRAVTAAVQDASGGICRDLGGRCPMHPRHDRASRDVEHQGEFAIGKAVHLLQHDESALIRSKLLEQALQGVGVLGSGHIVPRRHGVAACRRRVQLRQWHVASTRGEKVEAVIGRNAIEPSRESRLAAKLRDLPKHTQEYLLCCVLRIRV